MASASFKRQVSPSKNYGYYFERSRSKFPNFQEAHDDDDHSFFTFNPPVEHNKYMKNVLEPEFTTFKQARKVAPLQGHPKGISNFAESTPNESMEIPIKFIILVLVEINTNRILLSSISTSFEESP